MVSVLVPLLLCYGAEGGRASPWILEFLIRVPSRLFFAGSARSSFAALTDS